MSSIALLRPPRTPPAVSPEREALAAAIAVAQERRQRIAAATSAVASAVDADRAARRRQEEAEAGVSDARTAATAYAIAVARGNAGPPPVTVAEARSDLQTASDVAASAREARVALEAELADAQRWRDIPDMNVADAAAAVLAASPEVAALVQRVARAQRDLVDCGSALSWLASRKAAVPERRDEWGMPVHTPATEAVARLRSPPETWAALLTDGSIPGASPWAAALAALLVDADAALPR